MIVPLLCCVLQVAAADPGRILVRVGARAVDVPTVETGAGPAVRADLVTTPLGGRVRTLKNGHYLVSFPGVDFDVTAQVPFARAGDEVLPLTTAPFVERGRLYIPLQLVAELLPRLGSGVIYDAERGELRRFGPPPRDAATAPSPVRPTEPRVAAAPAGSARPAPGGAAPVRATSGTRRRLVVIDAGHGGPDNGMSGPIGSRQKIREKNITLAVGQKVADALRAHGVDVHLTRASDTLIALGDRGRIANQKRADLFISIHVNAANMKWRDPAAARGFETYFLAEAKTEEESRVERMENEAVRFETAVSATKGDPLSFIMHDMAQNEHLRESNDLAMAIQRSLRRVHPGPSRGVKQANFAVLRTSFMPAVLVELGFGTNPAESRFLSDADNQRALARSIASATVEYLSRYERRVGASAQ